MGTGMVVTYERVRAASYSRLLVGKQTCDQAQTLAIFGQRLVCSPGSTLVQQGLHLMHPLPMRKAAFTVMYCTAHCAAAREGGRSGLKERESLCEGEERETERRHNECVKISLAHPEKNSSMCY